ncbi:DUF1440 domain-containing protein [Erythrobacter litoralis]|uniref:DUF1440 domain-containing protein n=1 Tax=Erythrobacter litoralis TaxID=39960 RepID=UPI002435D5D8|nr:DUF1440 domain-containing protein [Erythrobacter litoralis]MDG6078641.1 DUF1440 domain-containing protein [Erythrobacter litoralis]
MDSQPLDLGKHALFGLVAGLAATAATAAFMQLASKPSGVDLQGEDEEGDVPIGSPQAATRAVDLGAETLTGHDVPDDAKEGATGAFQFAFGGLLGAAYGVAARLLPEVTAGRGTLFGTGIYALFDEVLVPATGLSGDPEDSPPRTHAFAFGAHLLFGGVAETVRRLLADR